MVAGGRVDVVFAVFPPEPPDEPLPAEAEGWIVLVKRNVEVIVESTRLEPTVTPTETEVDTTTEGAGVVPLVLELPVPLVALPVGWVLPPDCVPLF